MFWTTGTAPAQNLTLLRTRGLFAINLISATAAGDGFFGAVGIYMATSKAFAAGIGSMLGPFADSNSDMWLWHSFFDVRAITATIGDGVNAATAGMRVEIDSKAMRKNFDPERVMVGIVEGIEVGTASCKFHADTRQLFLS